MANITRHTDAAKAALFQYRYAMRCGYSRSTARKLAQLIIDKRRASS